MTETKRQTEVFPLLAIKIAQKKQLVISFSETVRTAGTTKGFLLKRKALLGRMIVLEEMLPLAVRSHLDKEIT